MLLGNKEAKVIPNILSVKCVSKSLQMLIIGNMIFQKRSSVKQDPTFDKETLDKNTIEKGYDDSFKIRQVAQSQWNPVFEEWDNNRLQM